jgi:hypothetical protein
MMEKLNHLLHPLGFQLTQQHFKVRKTKVEPTSPRLIEQRKAYLSWWEMSGKRKERKTDREPQDES